MMVEKKKKYMEETEDIIWRVDKLQNRKNYCFHWKKEKKSAP